MEVVLLLAVVAWLAYVIIKNSFAGYAEAKREAEREAAERQRKKQWEQGAQARRELQEKQRAEQAERQRQEAQRAARAAAARMAEMESWPIERLKHEVEDTRGRLDAAQRQYDNLWARYNDLMDDVGRRQSRWIESGGSPGSKDYPDASDIGYSLERQCSSANQELSELKRRYEEMSAVLRERWT